MVWLSTVLTIEILIAWRFSRRLRLVPGRLSTLELFVLGHLPLIAFGVLTCTWYYSMATEREVWVLAWYVPLALGGALAGAALARRLVAAPDPKETFIDGTVARDLRQTGLTCLLIMMIGLWGLWQDPRSLLDIIESTRTDRWVSSMDRVSFTQLNQLLIIPVAVLFAAFFVKGKSVPRVRILLFTAATAAFLFSCFVSLSRGRMVQALFALGVIAWHGGGRRTRRAILLCGLVGLILFGPMSVAVWNYRETLDLHAAIQSVTSLEWVEKMWSDPTFQCTDVCMAVLHDFESPRDRRYLDGVYPLIFFFVPRMLWTDKPMVFGPLVWQDVLGGSDEVIGVGPTFIAEGYATAGEAGILAGAFLLGMLLVFFESICHRYARPWEAAALIALTLVPAATIVRGDFHSAFIMRFVLYPAVFLSCSLVSRALLHILGRPGLHTHFAAGDR